MKTDYQAKQKRLANSELFERGLREGRSCLICRCWRRPCEACATKASARESKGATSAVEARKALNANAVSHPFGAEKFELTRLSTTLNV